MHLNSLHKQEWVFDSKCYVLCVGAGMTLESEYRHTGTPRVSRVPCRWNLWNWLITREATAQKYPCLEIKKSHRLGAWSQGSPWEKLALIASACFLLSSSHNDLITGYRILWASVSHMQTEETVKLKNFGVSGGFDSILNSNMTRVFSHPPVALRKLILSPAYPKKRSQTMFSNPSIWIWRKGWMEF